MAENFKYPVRLVLNSGSSSNNPSIGSGSNFVFETIESRAFKYMTFYVITTCNNWSLELTVRDGEVPDPLIPLATNFVFTVANALNGNYMRTFGENIVFQSGQIHFAQLFVEMTFKIFNNSASSANFRPRCTLVL